MIFAAWLNVLPSAGLVSIGNEDSLADKALAPDAAVLTLAAAHGASLTLYTRAAVLDVLGADFVRTAHAKGLAGRVVAFAPRPPQRRHPDRHHRRPEPGPPARRLGGGRDGVRLAGHRPPDGLERGRRDYPVLMVIALVVGVVVVAASFLTDVVYRWLDPRLGYVA